MQKFEHYCYHNNGLREKYIKNLKVPITFCALSYVRCDLEKLTLCGFFCNSIFA